MPHTHTAILYHLVFSTKDRFVAISDPAKLWAYTAGIAKNLHYHAYAIGGTGNHLHALAGGPHIPSFGICGAFRREFRRPLDL